MECRWMLKRSKADIKRLSKQLGIDAFTIKILSNRGLIDEKSIKNYLFGTLKDLYNPLLMKDMDKGTNIVLDAINKNLNIVIYGDYDADGVTSTTILYYALRWCGANVSYYIPNRESEGYGMCKDRLKILKEEGAQLILTCDNGITAIEEIKWAKELGLKVVVTDHHDVSYIQNNEGIKEYVIPEADAVINPKQKECSYPFKNLCGAGIALKFTQILLKKAIKDDKKWLELIQYAAIGTICDVVDLVNENRIIAKYGLKQLTNTNNIGLKALINHLQLQDKKIHSYHVGFIIGPCINATGRLKTADLSVELLLTNSLDNANKLATKLNQLNIERQNITQIGVEAVCDKIEKNNYHKGKVIVVYEKIIHESIAGIVAGRVRERYNLPTIVITEGKEMCKGSGRSIEEYNMFEELQNCKELMERFGGHPMAAGLSIKEKNIDILRSELNKKCILEEEAFIPKIRIDMQLPLKYISKEIIKKLEVFEPYGKENPTPIFAEKNIEAFKVYIIGKENNSLKFFCKVPGSFNKIDALAFDGLEKFNRLVIKKYGEETLNDVLNNKQRILLDMVFTPSVNVYNGNETLQVIIKDFRLSDIKSK